MKNKFLALLSAFLCALPLPALAGTSTVTTKNATGATVTFDVVTDGSGNFGPMTATCDGTALAQCAAVKAASTAAVATDPALVVAISPNNAIVLGTGGNTIGNVGTVGTITNPVTVAQATAANLKGQFDPLTVSTWGLFASTQNVASPTNAGLVGGQFNTTPTTILTGNVSPLQLDANGNLLVNVKVGGGTGGTSSTFGAAFPATGTAIGVQSGANMIAWPAKAANTVASTDVVPEVAVANATPGIANNNDGVAAVGASTTSPVPVVEYPYYFNGSTFDRVKYCNNHGFKHITSATDTLLVQGVTSQVVRVCGYKASFAGANAVFLENTASVNANCASANTQIAGQDSGVAQSVFGFYNPVWGGLANTVSNGLCLNSTGTGAVDVDYWYYQGP